MNYDFDYIVIGVGGIGSATLYWLTRNAPNAKILGLEQFELGHIRGGSQDHSRIVRRMYCEDKFMELAKQSYEGWNEIENESGLKLVYKTGGIFWTSGNSGMEYMVDEYFRAGRNAGLSLKRLNGTEIRQRWPQFHVDASASGVFDPEAGLVDAAMANAAHQQCALARGAKILTHTKVHSLTKLQGGGMKVGTNFGDVTCRKVAVTSGAWTNQVLATTGIQIPLRVTQENVSYFATPHIKDFTKERFPIFIHMDMKGCDYYALPIHGIAGFKIGLDAMGNTTTGDTRTFVPDPAREQLATNFIKKYIPKAFGRIIETKTCLYTMPYDRGFIIDTLASRNLSDVSVFCGAGHAFKFAALFGKVLSELAIKGQSDYDITPFTVNRPAVTDPSYTPNFKQMVTKEASKL